MRSSWQQIRQWHGSQNEAFEELVCQLAHVEKVSSGSHFRRKGKPDSGVECFWRLSDQTEWGWQAKFFVAGLGKSQWQQCDESVRRALNGHPNLKRLFFAFPCSFPDDPKKGKTTALQRWEQHCVKWADWSGNRLEIVLWDEHELLKRLSLPEHRGRWWFWFETAVLDSQWFCRHATSTVASSEAVARYSPQLHFDGLLNSEISAFGRTSMFTSKLGHMVKKVDRAALEFGKLEVHEELKKEWSHLGQLLRTCVEAGNALINKESCAKLPFQRQIEAAYAAVEQIEECRNDLWELATKERADHYSDDFSIRKALGEIASHLNTVAEFCDSIEAKLADSQSMILVADAGCGKTHLFCHTVESRNRRGEPAILVLGERFTEIEPWTQIIQFLGLDCKRDEFLGALDSAGEAAGCRSLIMIDALNEGVGIAFWSKHLASMLKDVSHYPHVSLAVSVRKIYARPTSLPLTYFIEVKYGGFAGRSAEAARHFFTKYGLAEPNIPLLIPEFDNPLFLKLTCEALRASGRDTLPSGLVGATAYFDFLLSSINERLAVILDYDVSEGRVQKAVLKLAELMADLKEEYLPLDVAKAALNVIHPATEYSKSLLNKLSSEHIVVRIPTPGSENSVNESVRFAYQRLSDHLIVQKILAGSSKSKIRALFEQGAIFGKPYWWGLMHSRYGWFEALAIQLPERFGVELDECLPHGIDDETVRGFFLGSLSWRTPASISTSTIRRIVHLFEGDFRFETLSAVVSVTARPGHPLNAIWLDRLLRKKSMPNRDCFWTMFLFGQMREDTSLKRLIDWGLAERANDAFEDEVVKLGCLTLVWCLTASDRFVRDRATKALVALLENRIALLEWLTEHFRKVDDPYVTERLYAVGYGCVLRTKQHERIAPYAQTVYDQIFKRGNPPPSVLLRNHTKGIVDRALSLGLGIKCDTRRLIPPFCSSWPLMPPPREKLERNYCVGKYDAEHNGYARVFRSVTADDFDHYIIPTALMWSSRKRTTKSRPPREILAKLLGSINKENRELLGFYVESCSRIASSKNGGSACVGREQESATEMEDFFRRYLEPEEWKALKEIIPWLKDSHHKKFRKVFDLELFRRLLLQRVIQLGFSPSLFGEFDNNVSAGSRSAHKAERIGKKYQWIAFDELHARICDNFHLAEEIYPSLDETAWLDGSWQNSFRDIDPSLLLVETFHDGWVSNQNGWWAPHRYEAWCSGKTPKEWLRSTQDLPEPKDFLLLEKDGSSWFALNSYANWEHKEEVSSFSDNAYEHQEIHYIFRSYIVRKTDLQSMIAWGKKQDWINDLLPSPHHSSDMHLHEHFSALPFSSPLEDSWVARLYPDNDLPCPFVETTQEYLCGDGGYDCSVDKNVNIHIPSRWLAKKMGLCMGGRRGEFFDKGGQLVVFDPSARDKGHGALVVRRNSFEEFLELEGLSIFWTLLAEKNIYPPDRLGRWPGRLTVLGLYWLNGGKIEGDFRTEFNEGQNG